jgi:tetratricopeptide (TPR) repeat protein
MKKITLAALLLAVSVRAAICAGYDALNVGIQYANDEAWDNAIQWLGKALDAGDLLPDQMRAAHYNRAKAYAASGRPGAAIPDFNAALLLTPEDVQLLTDRAFAYVADGHGDQALADLQKAREKRPKNIRINFLIGIVDWTVGRPDDASLAFAETIKLSKSDYAWLWLKLSDAKRKKETADVSLPLSTYVSLSTHYWPGPLVDLYRGRKDEADVLDSVKDYGDSQNCEAVFLSPSGGSFTVTRQVPSQCFKRSSAIVPKPIWNRCWRIRTWAPCHE